MKTRSLRMLMLLLVAFIQINAQELPPKHRVLHPILKADGAVVDQDGKLLGSIKDGKICLVGGQVIGAISSDGNVTTSSGKSVGRIENNGSMKSSKGHMITTDPDGAVKMSGKEVAKVENGYKDKSHGCALHCFFSSESDDSKTIDEHIHY